MSIGKKIMILFIYMCLLSSCSDNVNEQDGIIEDFVIRENIDKDVTQKITDNLSHNAFTDLVFFNNQFFLTFREGSQHVTGKDGVIIIYSSFDAINWILIKTISTAGIDLRDPKFSVNDDKLMLYIHGSQFINSNLVGRFDYVLKYFDESGWSNIENVYLDNLKISTYPIKINGNEAWPWRITWHKNKAYSVGYNGYDIFDLYQSDDGVFFKGLNAFQKRQGIPTEATVRFNTNGEMFILYRNNQGNSFIGKSTIYVSDWDWFHEIPIISFGGPNFIFLDEVNILITGRESNQLILSLYNITTNEYKKLLTLESGGDCGYAGMIIKDDFLYLSYYSSHAGPTGSSVYVAKISIKKLKF